jgi:hypothetical protein
VREGRNAYAFPWFWTSVAVFGAPRALLVSTLQPTSGFRSADRETPRANRVRTPAALPAPVWSRETKTQAGRSGSIAKRDGRWGGTSVDDPSPDARIATAPASVLTARNAQPRPRLHRAPFGVVLPSDPRRSILPRGNAGWGEHGDQDCEALGYLAFVTGPNNASVLSSRALGCSAYLQHQVFRLSLALHRRKKESNMSDQDFAARLERIDQSLVALADAIEKLTQTAPPRVITRDKTDALFETVSNMRLCPA